MRIEILATAGCGHAAETAELVAGVLHDLHAAALVERTIVASVVDAELLAFPGSPTVRVNGVDVEPDHPRAIGLG